MNTFSPMARFYTEQAQDMIRRIEGGGGAMKLEIYKTFTLCYLMYIQICNKICKSYCELFFQVIITDIL